MESVKLSKMRINLSWWASQAKRKGAILIQPHKGTDLVLTTRRRYMTLSGVNEVQTIKVSSSELDSIDGDSKRLELPGLEPLTLGDVTITDGIQKCYGKIINLELTIDSTIVDIEMYPF